MKPNQQAVRLRSHGVMVLLLGPLLPLTVAAAESSTRPNFVFVLGEGQGWTSMSVQMDPQNPESKSDFFYTPNLERLAAGGMRFTDFYAPSPRCTPSRATYFTGKSPAQLHMTFISTGGDTGGRLMEPRSLVEMPLEETTIAEHLQSEGYATAHFGKWHVGRIDPSRHGFDENDGATSNAGPGNTPNPNPTEAYGMTERGIAFMTRQVKAGKPFYLQLSHYPGRGVDDARQETVEAILRRGGGREERRVGAAAVNLDMDITIGMVLDQIDDLGFGDNTYVFYTADHGTPGRGNGPLANGKGTVWEGGIRVPLLVRGPGIQPGTFAQIRTNGADLFPTIAELAHVSQPLPEGIEGGSLVPVLRDSENGAVSRMREELVIHVPHYDSDPLGPTTALLLGPYKLIRVYETGALHLFDLSQDVGERHNLAREMPEKTAELNRRLSKYLEAVDAQLPTDNPTFDPSRDDRGITARGRRGGNRQPTDPIMAALDADNDGVLSAAEIEKIKTVLKTLDRDGDGRVARDELRVEDDDRRGGRGRQGSPAVGDRSQRSQRPGS